MPFFFSALGFVDSVRVTLAGTLDGTAEALVFSGVDSIQAAGSGSNLLLTAPLRPSLGAWETALQALQYTNSAMPPQSGMRQVRFIAYAANNVSDTAVAYLPIYSSTPSAGEDSSLSLCPDAPAADLFAALGGSPEAGGQWQPGIGTFDPAVDTPGDYLYIQSSPGCPPDTAVVSVSIAPAPAFSLGMDTLLCAGETLLLEAPPGLGAYEWSDGSPGGSLSVSYPRHLLARSRQCSGLPRAGFHQRGVFGLRRDNLAAKPCLVSREAATAALKCPCKEGKRLTIMTGALCLGATPWPTSQPAPILSPSPMPMAVPNPAAPRSRSRSSHCRPQTVCSCAPGKATIGRASPSAPIPCCLRIM